MRLHFAMVTCGLVAAGCGGQKTQPPPPQPAMTGGAPPLTAPASTNAPAPGLIVTPDAGLHGRVALVNPKARYVVISYPIGSLPQVDQVLGVYRNGLKVGEIRITGPRRDFNIAGDITNGECDVGDEVREQ